MIDIKKKHIVYICCMFFCMVCFYHTTCTVFAMSDPITSTYIPVESQHAIVFDLDTKQILGKKDADLPLPNECFEYNKTFQQIQTNNCITLMDIAQTLIENTSIDKLHTQTNTNLHIKQANIDGMNIIILTYGDETSFQKDVTSLTTYYKNKYQRYCLATKNEEILSVPISVGFPVQKVPVLAANDILLDLPINHKYSLEFVPIKPIAPPIEKDEYLGYVDVFCKNKQLHILQIDVYSNTNSVESWYTASNNQTAKELYQNKQAIYLIGILLFISLSLNAIYIIKEEVHHK